MLTLVAVFYSWQIKSTLSKVSQLVLRWKICVVVLLLLMMCGMFLSRG